jgi:ABC-2 type transport system permease protein
VPLGSDVPVAPSLLTLSQIFNPALFFNAAGAEHQVFRVMHPIYLPPAGNWLPLIAWAAVACVGALVGAQLLRLRHGEQAQMAGMNTPLAFFTAAMGAFLLFAALFSAVATVDVGAALALAGIAFVALSLFVLQGPLRGHNPLRRSLVVLAAECVCVGGCVLIIATGAFGFSARVPATDEVAAVEVSYVGTPSYLAAPLSGTASNAAYYYHSDYRFDDAADVETIREAHEGLIASARLPLATNADDFASTVVRYDLVVRYTLVDGSQQLRYFDRARLADLEGLLALDASSQVKALETAAISGDGTGLFDGERVSLAASNTALAFSVGSVYVADPNYNLITELELGEAPRAELLQALAKDVAAQDVRERYAQPKQPLATLMFTNSPQVDVSTFGFSFAASVVPITPDFSHTQAWFEANGLGSYLSEGVDPLLIEELAWLEDNPYASVVNAAAALPTSRFFIGYRSEQPERFWAAPDFGVPATTRDSTEIARAAPQLRTACFMGGGYLVQAKLRGVDVWVYYYLPTDEAPEFMGGAGEGQP